MALTEDNLDDLRTEMINYIQEYGLPTDRDALSWFQEVAREGTTPEQAFAPLYEGYFAGSGGMFSTEQWMGWTFNLENLTLRPDREGGVYFNFDFDFDDGDEDNDSPGSGSRGGYGTI